MSITFSIFAESWGFRSLNVSSESWSSWSSYIGIKLWSLGSLNVSSESWSSWSPYVSIKLWSLGSL